MLIRQEEGGQEEERLVNQQAGAGSCESCSPLRSVPVWFHPPAFKARGLAAMNGVLVRDRPLFVSCDGRSFGLARNSLFPINCLRGQTSLIISPHKERSLPPSSFTWIFVYFCASSQMSVCVCLPTFLHQSSAMVLTVTALTSGHYGSSVHSNNPHLSRWNPLKVSITSVRQYQLHTLDLERERPTSTCCWSCK